MSSKNWTQKKANKCRTVTELLVPLVFGFITGLAVYYSKIEPSTVNIESILTFWLLILFFTPFMYIQGVIFILNQMVADRETKMRETLKIMGLGRVSYGMSYLVM
jgi:phage shock protein PspC (stress-responsive transcriptional regulator)